MMSNDLQQARISVEVLNEYRKIAAWLEAQAATRGPVGDTMHGLAAEALTNLIEHEYSRHTIPLYGMLDVWTALYGTSHPEFDEFYAEHGYAEAWAQLLSEVRKRAAAPAETEYRVDPDRNYVYWRDPIEGCWVAFKRADCVGEEELPVPGGEGENGD